jgi:tripartite-type tricarboxylate transporter receptor subunit TctC
LTYASAGIGSPTHIAPELFKSMARLSMLHIPYKGGSQAITDLLGGQTSLYFSAMSTGLPLAKSGRLRALGVTSPQRFVGLADIPTIAESGLPGYSLVGWFGLLLPANTPLDTVNRLHDAANRVLATPEIKDRLILEGIEAQAQTVQAFDSFLQKELEKYAKIVRDARILPE